METRVIGQVELDSFLEGILADYRLIAPVEAEPGYYRFDEIEDVREVVTTYGTTVLPPKKAMFPPVDVLLTYRTAENGKPMFEPVVDTTPQVLFGVHPCDLAGIAMLDRVFEREHRDEHYLARRAASTVIGIDCQPDEHCFCSSVDTDEARGCYDLFLTPIDTGFLVDVGTERGSRLLDELAQTDRAAPEHLAQAGRWREKKRNAIQRSFDTPLYNLPLTFQHGVTSSVWEETAETCLSCGSCNLVCPTCFCFDVEDIPDLGGGGVRQRTWDGCQLRDFAEVAGGHNFRPEEAQRLRHRFYRKYQYLMMLYGHAFCTGCGRCGRSCPVDINVVDTINALVPARVEREVDRG